jgi:hypothetical protein
MTLLLVALLAASPRTGALEAAIVTSVEAADLVEYPRQSNALQDLIDSGLELTRRNLTYLYGSSDPANRGMDCSGAIHYLLTSHGFDQVPRQSDQLYAWLEKAGTLTKTTEPVPERVSDLKDLKPGDLLFWSGTYRIDRKITHVMMYLGTDEQTGQPVMFGASDGRDYRGKPMRGVSVFSFRLPRPESRSKFEGYGPVPGMAESSSAADRAP